MNDHPSFLWMRFQSDSPHFSSAITRSIAREFKINMKWWEAVWAMVIWSRSLWMTRYFWPQNWQSKVSLIMINMKIEDTFMWNCTQKQKNVENFTFFIFENISLFFVIENVPPFDRMVIFLLSEVTLSWEPFIQALSELKFLLNHPSPVFERSIWYNLLVKSTKLDGNCVRFGLFPAWSQWAMSFVKYSQAKIEDYFSNIDCLYSCHISNAIRKLLQSNMKELETL